MQLEAPQFAAAAVLLQRGAADGGLADLLVQAVVAGAAAAGQALEGRQPVGQGGLAQQHALAGAGEVDAGAAAGSVAAEQRQQARKQGGDRKSTRLNSSHV